MNDRVSTEYKINPNYYFLAFKNKGNNLWDLRK